MATAINKSRLFNASCMALVVTSMSFAIRAGSLNDITASFSLSEAETAMVSSIWALGFPIAATLGGFFVDALGMKRFMWLAVIAHALGILMTMFAAGYWSLFIATFLIGFANGTVEAVCNPLIATIYPENKTTMLNKFHVWFPGGIVIGSLLGDLMKDTLHLDWQVRIGLLLVPTAIYAYMFWGQEFPKTERVTSGVSLSGMFAACLTPLFLFMGVCMFFTANTELATTGFVQKLLGNAGANPMLILALVTGLMAVGRYFGGPIIHKLSPQGVLLMSAIVSVIGIFLLKQTTGPAVYGAAIVFALGVCYFWPTMLGFVSENIPQSGALGLSIIGGIGMLGNWAYQSFFLGPQLDAEKAASKALGMTDANQIDLLAGQSVLGNIWLMPIFLVLCFVCLHFYMKSGKTA